MFKLLENKALKSILNNFSWLFFHKIVQLGSSFIIGILLARYFGVENYGIYSIVLAITTIFTSLSTFGLNHLVTKEIKSGDFAVGKVIGTAVTIRILASVLSLFAILMVSGLLVDEDMEVYLYLIVFSQIFLAFKVVEYYFLANSNMKPFIILNVCHLIIFALLKLVLLYFRADMTSFFILLAIETAVIGIATLILYILNNKNTKKLQFESNYAKGLLKKGFPLVLSSFTAIIYLKLDILMLSYYTTKFDVGIYAVASRLSEVWYVFPTLIATAVFPKILELKKSSKEKYEKNLQRVLDLLAFSATILAIVVTFLAPFIISILFGDAYLESVPVLQIHIWASVFIFMRALASKWFIAEDLYYLSFVTHGAGAILNVILNIILIPMYGPIGAAVATVVSYAGASYFSLFFVKSSRNFAYSMTKAIFWPRYILKFAKLKRVD